MRLSILKGHILYRQPLVSLEGLRVRLEQVVRPIPGAAVDAPPPRLLLLLQPVTAMGTTVAITKKGTPRTKTLRCTACLRYIQPRAMSLHVASD